MGDKEGKTVFLRGEIYYSDSNPVIVGEQGGIRPVPVFQNNTGNRFSLTVIVADITSCMDKYPLTTQVFFGTGQYGLQKIQWLCWSR
ncbi:type II toxin-antitoxin system PemK/MazF family toxin [Enterocloster bolteae]|uniref:type II toxin-antitoxin system PemK/MazF family toxin n=1 Tax=Enterocloster bolteae TaxID=208479 RepID=UPI0003FCA0B6|nr:type II toxin-antitoxin system PemK/MazF family toxin [Enterocloster bolteae]UOX68039.1 type II toxin-antitoxin system PemK/MazF family toxin [Enterocloster bolteae]